MFKRDLGIGAVLGIVFAIVLAVNLIGAIALERVKVDMTEDRLYTLSEGSKRMLGKLEDDVTVKVYYSKRAANAAPAIKQYGERVIELLKQFQTNSGGKLKLEVLNPLPDTEDEEWAVKYGLRPLPSQEPLYFGLVAIGEGGAEQAIPFLDPQREGFLEYDTARIIAAVSHPKKKKVGILSPLPVLGGADPMARMQGRPQQPAWVFVEELRRSYEVVEVPTTTASIDDTIDLLLVIHPKNLSEQTEYAIDQYVLKGKNAVILVDPNCEYELENFRDPNPQGRFQASFESNLPKLFEAWGLDLEKGKVIGDMTTGAMVNTGQEVKKYIIWLMLKGDTFNREELSTSGLEQMTFASAGQLKKREGAKYAMTPLIQSPPTAKLVDAFILKLGADPDELAKDYQPGNEKLTMAWKITGKFETAFPGGKPASSLPRTPGEGEKEEPKNEGGDKPHLATAEKEGTVIVVGDVDTLSDRFAVQVQNMFGRRIITTPYDNLNFFFNAFELLSGSDDLVSLRTRGKSARPFLVVDQIEERAQQKWKAKEDELRKKIDDANQKLQELQGGRGAGDQAVLSAAQVEEINKFQAERAATMKELRLVRRSLREDIESLGAFLKFLNIALMPLLVTALAFVPAWWRNQKIKGSRG